MSWDPFRSTEWARALGLAHVSMFAGKQQDTAIERAVLLDGRASSVALMIGDDDELAFADEPLGWTWSSSLTTLINVDRSTKKAFARNWASPGDRRQLRLPRSSDEAVQSFQEAIEGRRSTANVDDVVTRMVTTFRRLRAALNPLGTANESTIDLFNLLLLLADDDDRRDELDSCVTVDDTLTLADGIDFAGLGGLDDIVRNAKIESAIDLVANPDSAATRLSPTLLLRHAAGHVYQEAHFELERV